MKKPKWRRKRRDALDYEIPKIKKKRARQCQGKSRNRLSSTTTDNIVSKASSTQNSSEKALNPSVAIALAML
ncbi:hypothetical protein V6N13_114324 [Hibiscus sabdariffa]|uniref:Uncharacterized protein n=1 Tax=Hibiscus sabdariffa TaxID=183260 RepID=A0ABR2U1X3_9ROSI